MKQHQSWVPKCHQHFPSVYLAIYGSMSKYYFDFDPSITDVLVRGESLQFMENNFVPTPGC